MHLLSVSGLKKSFKSGFLGKRSEVLSGIDFNIKGNSITGFLGANGAGKTTTLKCILSLIFPDEGEVSFFGRTEFDNEVKRRIGFLPERPYFYHYLTGVEFLQFYGEVATKLKRRQLLDRIDSLLKRVDLTFAKNKPLREYSKGMLQKIGLAQALIHEPELLILDEPMAGLDPDGRYYLGELIRETAREGRAVFFSSHLLHDTEMLCESLVILKNKKVFFNGPTSELLKSVGLSYEVFYLKNGLQERVMVQSVEELPQKITELKLEGCVVEKVDQNKMTLEEYFVKDILRIKS